LDRRSDLFFAHAARVKIPGRLFKSGQRVHCLNPVAIFSFFRRAETSLEE
jgi:hypothetical protein